jgi:hypothetical protein
MLVVQNTDSRQRPFHGGSTASNSAGDTNVQFTVSVIEIGAGFGTPPVFVDEMVMR